MENTIEIITTEKHSKEVEKEILKSCKASCENKHRFTKLKSSPRRNNKSDRKKRRALKLCKN